MDITKKKYLFIIMALLLLSLIVLIPRYDYKFVDYIVPNSEVSFYTTTKSTNLPAYINKVDIGHGEILKCKSHMASSALNSIDNIAGISFCFEGSDEDIEEYLKRVDAVILKCEKVDANITTYLAYSKKFQNSVHIDDKTINLQIAKVGSTITIGSPLILGEY